MKFNDRRSSTLVRPDAPRGALGTVSATPDGVTHAGGAGYQRDARTELFLLATTQLYGEANLYATADENVARFGKLVAELAVDPETWPWVRGFLRWLRGDGNIRSASVALAAEAVHARLAAGLNGDGNRELIASVLQRPDEPAELIAYWDRRFGTRQRDPKTGRLIGAIKLPKPVKRGVADAVNRLYDEGAFLRYDGEGKDLRFGDVLDLTHAKGNFTGAARFTAPADVTRDALPRTWQDDLFKWSITARHRREGAEPQESLRSVRARWDLSRLPADARHALGSLALSVGRDSWDDNEAQRALDRLNLATVGQWEWLLSWLGEKPTDVAALTEAQRWELVVPRLGYMAALRNLRNLDQAGVSDAVAGQLVTRLTDPAQVRKSRQLPFRFYSAYKNAPSLRWGHALEVALTHSLANLPELTGRSLVLIDTSGSMQYNLSARSEMNRVTAAALFALALALKNPTVTDVFGFADGQFRVAGVERGFSVLKAVEAFTRQVGVVGHGTRIELAVRSTFDPARHDRVLIFSDMQTFPAAGQALRAMPYAEHIGDVSAAVPAHVPVYAFNLAGHERTAMPVVTGNRRYELGGLTDHTLGQIESLERGLAGAWPWMVQ